LGFKKEASITARSKLNTKKNITLKVMTWSKRILRADKASKIQQRRELLKP
jgi:hypothetical protein